MQFSDLLRETGEVPCHSAPDLFFESDTDAPDTMSTAMRHNLAKKLCNECPIRQQCLSYAMKNNIGFGVWGQTTPLERKMIRSA